MPAIIEDEAEKLEKEMEAINEQASEYISDMAEIVYEDIADFINKLDDPVTADLANIEKTIAHIRANLVIMKRDVKTIKEIIIHAGFLKKQLINMVGIISPMKFYWTV